MLPTFPYFQLSLCGDLINDLGLTTSSYLDTWIPSLCRWEQQTISVVRIVETQQRLLYKIRRRLTEPLSDPECLSLHEELRLQGGNLNHRTSSLIDPLSGHSPPKPRRLSLNESSISRDGQNTRTLASTPSPDTPDSGNSPKLQLVNGYYMAHPNSSIVTSSEDPTSTQPPSSNATSGRPNGDGDNMFIYQNMYYSQQSQQQQSNDNGLPQYLLTPPASAAPIPYHPHPPLKRWPNDYTVSEIASGFHVMDLLISHASSTGGMTQRQAFERVFGCRYVKSTVCRHRAVWRKANQPLKEQFEALGSDERGGWGEFVRRVEGRPPGKSGSISDSMMTSSPTATLGYQSGGDDEDVHGQEGVMSPLQNQSLSLLFELFFILKFSDKFLVHQTPIQFR